ncbi:MAG: hypothetical protein ABGX15_03135 [Paracoccaceae bacterium]
MAGLVKLHSGDRPRAERQVGAVVTFDEFAANVSLMLSLVPEAVERKMSGLEALIAGAGLGILATPLVVLPRRRLIPALVALVGMGILGALAVQWGRLPCRPPSSENAAPWTNVRSGEAAPL